MVELLVQGLCPYQGVSGHARVGLCPCWGVSGHAEGSLCIYLGSLPMLEGLSAYTWGLCLCWGVSGHAGLTAAPPCCAWQNSRNIAFEAYVVKPESYVGLSCVAFQRRDGGPSGRPSQAERGSEPVPDQQLRLRCTTGRPNISLTSFHIKVWVSRELGVAGEGGSAPAHQ